MLPTTETDPLTRCNSDIIQIWNEHDHVAIFHISRSPAGGVVFNVQLTNKEQKTTKKTTLKSQWIQQNIDFDARSMQTRPPNCEEIPFFLIEF